MYITLKYYLTQLRVQNVNIFRDHDWFLNGIKSRYQRTNGNISSGQKDMNEMFTEKFPRQRKIGRVQACPTGRLRQSDERWIFHVRFVFVPTVESTYLVKSTCMYRLLWSEAVIVT